MTTAKLKQEELETLVESKLKLDGTTGDAAVVELLSAKIAQEIVRELSHEDSGFLKELKNIVSSIDSAKDEIAAIRPKATVPAIIRYFHFHITLRISMSSISSS